MKCCSDTDDIVDSSNIPYRDCARHVVNKIASKRSQAKRSARVPYKHQLLGIQRDIEKGTTILVPMCVTKGATNRMNAIQTFLSIL
jgi:hypothetical protein